MSSRAKPVNCIVDASALLASVANNATASIKPWLQKNAINVYVPLHALTRLTDLRNSDLPGSSDAAKAINWLDTITTATAGKTAGRVQLQEPDHEYATWREVESHLLPSPTLSFNDTTDGMDAISHMLNNNLGLENSNGPGPIASKQYGLFSTDSSQSSHSDGRVAPTKILFANGCTRQLLYKPDSPELKPLINFVVWRSNHKDADLQSSGPYILLTNDKEVLGQARKFGARAKLLTQLPLIVSNNNIEAGPDPEEKQGEDPEDSSDEEDRVVFDPSQRPGSSRNVPKRNSNVIDPDSFGRNPNVKPIASVPQPSRGMDDIARQAAVSSTAPTTPPRVHANGEGTRGSPKGRRRGNGQYKPRANINPPRGGGHRARGNGPSPPILQSNGAPASARGAFQNGNLNGFPGRGRAHPRNGLGYSGFNRGAARGGRGGRGGAIPTGSNGHFNANPSFNGSFVQQIDPDSYVRTAPGLAGRGGRGGRGGPNMNGRKLWIPEG